MERQRKKKTAIFAFFMFAIMMMLNVNSTSDGTNINVAGCFAMGDGTDVGENTGTCCQQLNAECVVGTVVRLHRYYISEGPC